MMITIQANPAKPPPTPPHELITGISVYHMTVIRDGRPPNPIKSENKILMFLFGLKRKEKEWNCVTSIPI